MENTVDNSIIIKEIENVYYKIISKKDISDHKLIYCKETKTISWNIENDVGYMTTYVYDNKENNLDKFPENLRPYINNIYGIGKNFRNQMEKSEKYYDTLQLRYKKVCEILKKYLSQDCDYTICIQECSRNLFDFLKENLELKFCKFIKQDTESISVGKVIDLCDDVKNIFNYPNNIEYLENNNPILHNVIKKYYDLICSGTKNITRFDLENNWKNFLSNKPDLWNDFIDIMIKSRKDKFYEINLKSNEQHSYGHAILSNKDFILLPSLSRMLYSNNFIIVDNYNDCVGGFVVKSRGCYAVGLDIMNVHLSKGRVGFDYDKISNHDFFSIDFELTRQIDKYLFGSMHDNGLLKIFYEYFILEDLIVQFKENFINCFIKKLYTKFIKSIKETNYTEGNELFLKEKCIKINLIEDCPINLELKSKNPTQIISTKKYFINENSLSVFNENLYMTRKVIFVGDFNDQIENIVGMFLKYYNIKIINNFDENLRNQIITGVIKKIYTSDRIDHILEIEYINVEQDEKFKKYNHYVKKLVSNIEMSKYELIKNNNIISWNVNCRNNAIYYFNPKDKLKFYIGLEDVNSDLIDKIIRNSLTYTLGEIKSKKILEEILDNIVYLNGEISTKIYLQEANFDLIKYLKDNLNYKYAKFVSECITNLHLLNFNSYLTKEHKIRETANVYYSNIYNNSNKLGYCIFSNSDFTVLPYSINSTIEYKEDKDIFDIKINCVGCIDITNNILCINKYLCFENIVKNNILDLNTIVIHSVNTNLFYEEDKDKLDNLINTFRNILFTKFSYIIKDYNYESSNRLNDFIEIQPINYSEKIHKNKLDTFENIYLDLLTDQSIHDTNEYFTKLQINKLTIVGNYFKSNKSKEDKDFRPRFCILKNPNPFEIKKTVIEEDLYTIPKTFKKKIIKIIENNNEDEINTICEDKDVNFEQELQINKN